MAKRIALKDYISCDGVDISTWVRAVGFTSEDDRVDASGFNSTGASEFLLGVRTREVTLEIIMARGTTEVHQVLYPLHRDRTAFDFVWRADSSNVVSATNPELRGSVLLAAWGEGATRGDLETTTLTLVTATTTGLEFYAT